MQRVDEGVAAGATHQHIAAALAGEDVVAVTARQRIVKIATEQLIVAANAEQHFASRSADQEVSVFCALESCRHVPLPYTASCRDAPDAPWLLPRISSNGCDCPHCRKSIWGARRLGTESANCKYIQAVPLTQQQPASHIAPVLALT